MYVYVCISECVFIWIKIVERKKCVFPLPNWILNVVLFTKVGMHVMMKDDVQVYCLGYECRLTTILINGAVMYAVENFLCLDKICKLQSSENV